MKRTLREWQDAWRKEKVGLPESMRVLGDSLLLDWSKDRYELARAGNNLADKVENKYTDNKTLDLVEKWDKIVNE